ncbi:MAG: DUF1800 family protein [Acidobacteriota bacterium]
MVENLWSYASRPGADERPDARPAPPVDLPRAPRPKSKLSGASKDGGKSAAVPLGPAAQLFRRFGFGHRPGDLEALRAVGTGLEALRGTFVDSQITAPSEDPEVERRLARLSGRLEQASPSDRLRVTTLLRRAHGRAQLREKTVAVWHEVLAGAGSNPTVPDAALDRRLRRRAFGPLRRLAPARDLTPSAAARWLADRVAAPEGDLGVRIGASGSTVADALGRLVEAPQILPLRRPLDAVLAAARALDVDLAERIARSGIAEVLRRLEAIGQPILSGSSAATALGREGAWATTASRAAQWRFLTWLMADSSAVTVGEAVRAATSLDALTDAWARQLFDRPATERELAAVRPLGRGALGTSGVERRLPIGVALAMSPAFLDV